MKKERHADLIDASYQSIERYVEAKLKGKKIIFPENKKVKK